MSKVWLNGEIFDEKDAKISVRDRGFLFGDGIFSTLKCNDCILFSPSKHIKNLKKHSDKIGIYIDETNDIKTNDIINIIRANGGEKGGMWRVKIIVSGGVSRALDLSKRACGNICILVDKMDCANVLNNNYKHSSNNMSNNSNNSNNNNSNNNNNNNNISNINRVINPSCCAYNDDIIKQISAGILHTVDINMNNLNNNFFPHLITQLKSLSFLQKFALKQHLSMLNDGTVENNVKNKHKNVKYTDLLCLGEGQVILECIFSNIFWICKEEPCLLKEREGEKEKEEIEKEEEKKKKKEKEDKEEEKEEKEKEEKKVVEKQEAEKKEEKKEEKETHSKEKANMLSITSHTEEGDNCLSHTRKKTWEEYTFYSPCKTLPILYGNTISDVREVCSRMGMKIKDVCTPFDQINTQDTYVYTCNSLHELQPVMQINDKIFQMDLVLHSSIWNEYQNYVEKVNISQGG